MGSWWLGPVVGIKINNFEGDLELGGFMCRGGSRARVDGEDRE